MGGGAKGAAVGGAWGEGLRPVGGGRGEEPGRFRPLIGGRRGGAGPKGRRWAVLGVRGWWVVGGARACPLPMRGCADDGGMVLDMLFKRNTSDRSTVTPLVCLFVCLLGSFVCFSLAIVWRESVFVCVCVCVLFRGRTDVGRRRNEKKREKKRKETTRKQKRERERVS